MATDSYTTLTKRVHAFLKTKWGLWGLAFISFWESALPIPILTDPFLVVYILANQRKTLLAVFVTTLSSVVGGVIAYTAAYFVREPILSLFSPEFIVQFNDIASRLQGEMFAFSLLGAITPVPYTTVALAAGFISGNIWLFIAASVLGRFARYAVVGYMTARVGEYARTRKRSHIPLMILSFGSLAVLTIYFILKLI